MAVAVSGVAVAGVAVAGDGVEGRACGGGGGVVVGGAVVAVQVRAATHHGRHGERQSGEAGQHQAGRPGLMPAHHGCSERRSHRDRAEEGARGVGELRCLSDLEALDPRDARDPRGEPTRHGCCVDSDGADGDGPAGPHETEQPRAELQHRDDDEDPGQSGMLSVDADRRGVHGACAQRGHARDRDARQPANLGDRRSRDLRTEAEAAVS